MSCGRAERTWQIFVGLVLVIAGIGIWYALFAIQHRSLEDLWDIGVFLAAEAYSLVGGLFILLGLRYMLGPSSWVRHRIGGSLRQLGFTLLLLSLMTLALYVVILIAHANRVYHALPRTE